MRSVTHEKLCDTVLVESGPTSWLKYLYSGPHVRIPFSTLRKLCSTLRAQPRLVADWGRLMDGK
jgi:hypothetical protein